MPQTHRQSPLLALAQRHPWKTEQTPRLALGVMGERASARPTLAPGLLLLLPRAPPHARPVDQGPPLGTRAGGKRRLGLTSSVREVAFGCLGLSHLQLPGSSRQSSRFPSARLYLHPGDRGKEKRLCAGSQWSPESLQSRSEGAGPSLWEPKGAEIKGAGESITIHIWFIHMFGYLKGFNGSVLYLLCLLIC